MTARAGTASAAQALFLSQARSIFPAAKYHFPVSLPFVDKLNDALDFVHDLVW